MRTWVVRTKETKVTECKWLVEAETLDEAKEIVLENGSEAEWLDEAEVDCSTEIVEAFEEPVRR